MTFPLIAHPDSHIPLGSEGAGTVPFFNLWTLQWNIDQLLRGYPSYWQAPIFAPTRGAFAFSEPQPLSALLALPLWLGFRSPGLAYNGLVVLFLTLNGWFCYWLLRTWQAAHGPALLAGLLAQSMPFVAQEMGVLQLTAVFGFLWSLLYLNRFLAQPNRANALGLALGLPVAFFTCSYYGFFSLLFLPLAFFFLPGLKGLAGKTAGRLCLISLLALALVLPLTLAQKAILDAHQLSRSPQTIQNNSARLRDYRLVLDYNLLYGRPAGRRSEQGQRLFPGWGLLLLAGVGVAGKRQKWDRLSSLSHKAVLRVKLYLCLAVILALVLSLGLNLQPGGWQPYQALRQTLPGFERLRSPFRFAALVQLHLVLLAGFGLDNLLRSKPETRLVTGLGRLLPLAVAGFALLEMLALPLPLQALPPTSTGLPWQTWLNGQGGKPRLILLPFAPSPQVADFEQTTRWMLAGRAFAGEMVNGYSGFFPSEHAALRPAMLEFPTPEGLRLLRERGVDYIVVYHALAGAPSKEAMEAHLPLVFYDPEQQVGVFGVIGY